MRAIVVLLLAVGCTAAQSLGPVTTDPGESGGKADSGSDTGGGGGAASIPDVQCPGTPDAGPAGSFHHISSELISDLGSPNHRGIDLVAPASAGTQTIEGDISYTVADKALEDEDVDLFACREGAWEKIGTARTDDEGHFALPLTADARLPIGLRDMYVSVVGDRTGASFLALVAPDGAPLFVSDVDGTLTSSENAFPESLVTGGDPGVQPGAPDAYQAAAAKGMTLVYLTSRGTEFTADTRGYLAAEGFPRGPLRLSKSFVTLPGGDTVDFKTGALKSFSAGLTIAAGVGNRESDVEAYTNAGVPADRIFIKLPEYQSEVQSALDANQAIGFDAYDDLRTQYIANM